MKSSEVFGQWPCTSVVQNHPNKLDLEGMSLVAAELRHLQYVGPYLLAYGTSLMGLVGKLPWHCTAAVQEIPINLTWSEWVQWLLSHGIRKVCNRQMNGRRQFHSPPFFLTTKSGGVVSWDKLMLCWPPAASSPAPASAALWAGNGSCLARAGTPTGSLALNNIAFPFIQKCASWILHNKLW